MMVLKWVYPADNATVYEAATFVLGSASMDVDEITLNNVPVACTPHIQEQAFAVPIVLKPGMNNITLRANTGESIIRNVRRIAPLSLSEDAPLRPLFPDIPATGTDLPCFQRNLSIPLSLLAHESLESIWVQLLNANGQCVLQYPLCAKAVYPLPPHREYHAQARNIFAGLHVDAHHPPLALNTRRVEGMLPLRQLTPGTIVDGEELLISYLYTRLHDEDHVHQFSAGQRFLIWEYPRHIQTTETLSALYQGYGTQGQRLALSPPAGTPFLIQGQLSSEQFVLMGPNEPTAVYHPYMLHGPCKALPHVGVTVPAIIPTAHVQPLFEGAERLVLLSNEPFGLHVYPQENGLTLNLHHAFMGNDSLKLNRPLVVENSQETSEAFHIDFPARSSWHIEPGHNRLQWHASQPLRWKGIHCEWKEQALHLETHMLPTAWERLVIVLDAGHGGDETGTLALNGIPEKQWVLGMVKRIKTLLQNEGVKQVFLTREQDVTLPLSDRQRYVSQHNTDICLSLHANALPDGRNPLKHQGVSVHTFTPWSHALGDVLQQAISRFAKRREDARFHSNFAMTRLPTCQSALIEYGYFIHPQEFAELLDEDVQHALAQATVQGLRHYFEMAVHGSAPV
jgi:N-acetylmuramoyl-L-alanine amidase